MYKFLLTGAIGNDAKVNYVSPERSAINFSVANNRTYRRENEQITETRWVECVKYVNNGKEKIAEYLTKGRIIAIEGEPEAASYIDSEGNLKNKLKVVVDDIDFLTGK